MPRVKNTVRIIRRRKIINQDSIQNEVDLNAQDEVDLPKSSIRPQNKMFCLYQKDIERLDYLVRYFSMKGKRKVQKSEMMRCLISIGVNLNHKIILQALKDNSVYD